jgi:archaemetzincin
MRCLSRFYIFVVVASLCACGPKNETIGLQVYEDFPLKWVQSIQGSLEQAYGLPVYILKSRALPDAAFINIKSPRYRADSLLKDLVRYQPDSISYCLGLTLKDISTTKRNAQGGVKEPVSKYQDWGVFGLGYRPGPSSVVSSFRFRNVEDALFLDRLKKICTHEIGHNLGLKHCDNSGCVMADAAETIKTVDFVGFLPCEECQQKIK